MVTPAVRLAIGAALTAAALAVVIAYPTSTSPNVVPATPTGSAAVVQPQPIGQRHHHDARGSGGNGGR